MDSSDKKHTLMDGGAIYLYTIHDNVTIRSNLIFSYYGRHGYRSIFCDDATMNAKIYNNVIVNDMNSYAIDLRYEHLICAKIQEANKGNNIYGNIYSGLFKFQDDKGHFLLTNKPTKGLYVFQDKVYANKELEKRIKTCLCNQIRNEFLRFY